MTERTISNPLSAPLQELTNNHRILLRTVPRVKLRVVAIDRSRRRNRIQGFTADYDYRYLRSDGEHCAINSPPFFVELSNYPVEAHLVQFRGGVSNDRPRGVAKH